MRANRATSVYVQQNDKRTGTTTCIARQNVYLELEVHPCLVVRYLKALSDLSIRIGEEMTSPRAFTSESQFQTPKSNQSLLVCQDSATSTGP